MSEPVPVGGHQYFDVATSIKPIKFSMPPPDPSSNWAPPIASTSSKNTMQAFLDQAIWTQGQIVNRLQDNTAQE
jgi:hypothetical protein